MKFNMAYNAPVPDWLAQLEAALTRLGEQRERECTAATR